MAVVALPTTAGALFVASVQGSFGAFESEDVLEAFLSHAYVASSWKNVNQLAQLKRVSKFFRFAIVCQLTSNKSWRAPVIVAAKKFALHMDDFLVKHEYVVFFDTMRLTRIESRVQIKALCALDTHMKKAACMAVLQKKTHKDSPPGRCKVIAEVIQFHNKANGIVKTGLAILLRLVKDEQIAAKYYDCIICAVVDAMCNFPEDRSMQYAAVETLYLICKRRSAPNFNINKSTHYATVYILAAMLMFPEDEDFQVRGVAVLKETTASKWCWQPKRTVKDGKKDLVDVVWEETVENVLLRIMHTHKTSQKMAVDGCQVLAQMANNNLDNLTKMRKLTATMLNWMQMFAAGRNLHAAAMMPVTAMGVRNFSYETTGPHQLNQNFFGEAGAIQLMLAGLHSYARSLFAWPIMTASTVIQALDAVCRNHFINTTRFIHARGVNVIIRAAFASTMNPDTVNGINFSGSTFTSTFAMLKNILSHTERKRKNCANGQELCPENPVDETETTSMPFLHVLSGKFANTCNKQVCSRQEYSVTQLAVLCLKAAVRCLRDNSKHQKPSETLVLLCLELLGVCMLSPVGMKEMRDNGVQVVLLLLKHNAAKKFGNLTIDVACMQVLSTAASRSRMLPLYDGLLEVAMGVPGHFEGIHVKISEKNKTNPEYVVATFRAKHAVVTLRTALVRMQIKECMHLLLAAADDDGDKAEIMKHTRVRVGIQEEVAHKINQAESQIVNSQFFSAFLLVCTFVCL